MTGVMLDHGTVAIVDVQKMDCRHWLRQFLRGFQQEACIPIG